MAGGTALSGEADPEADQGNPDLRARHRPRRHQRVAAAWAADTVDARAFWPFPRRALLSVALAAGRARPGLGAPAPCPARAESAPHPACAESLRPSAGKGNRRPPPGGKRSAQEVGAGRRCGFFFAALRSGSFERRSNSAWVSLPSLLRSARSNFLTISAWPAASASDSLPSPFRSSEGSDAGSRTIPGSALAPAAADGQCAAMPGLFFPLTATTPVIAMERKRISPTRRPEAKVAAGPMAGAPAGCMPASLSFYAVQLVTHSDTSAAFRGLH